MKKTYLAMAVAAASFVATPAIAQDYQMEAGLSYISLDKDSGGSDSAIGVDFTYNLEQVSTAGKPLAEAAWLNRNNNVGLGFTTVDKADRDIINLNGEFWLDDIYLAADVDRWDGKNFVGDSDDDIDLQVSAGFMVNEGLLAYAKVNKNTSVYDKTGFGLGAKYVADLGANFVNLEGELNSIDSNMEINVAGDYYLSNELSVGLSLSALNLDDKYKLFMDDKLEVGINAKYFFLPNAYGSLEYVLNNDHTDKDSAIGLRIAARF